MVKRKITAFFASVVFFMNMSAFVVSADTQMEFFYDSISKTVKLAGNIDNEPDEIVIFEVLNGEGKIVFSDAVISGEAGAVIVSADAEDWEDGEYTFKLTTKSGTIYTQKADKPFSANTSLTSSYKIENAEIWFWDKKSVDANVNSVMVTTNDIKLKTGIISNDLLEISGVPEGMSIKAQVIGSNAINISLLGTAESNVEESKIDVTVKQGAILSGLKGDLKISGISIVPEKLARSARYTDSGLSFKMKNSTQISESGASFIVTPIRKLNVNGELKKGTHFDYDESALDGLEIKAAANKETNTIKLTLEGESNKDITSDLQVSGFVLKASIVEDAIYDSEKQSIKITAATSAGQSSGSTSTSSNNNSSNSSESSTNSNSGVSSPNGNTGYGFNTDIIETPLKPFVPDLYVEFTDMENHWAKDYVEIIAGKGIVDGVGNGMFAPNKKVTRAEFTKMIINALDIPAGSRAIYFEDVSENDWFCSYVAAGVENNIVSKDTKFRPNDAITREEMTKMVSQAVLAKIEKPVITMNVKSFADFVDISEWAVEHIEVAQTLGLVVGNSEGKFMPKANATRAEAATVICRALEFIDR